MSNQSSRALDINHGNRRLHAERLPDFHGRRQGSGRQPKQLIVLHRGWRRRRAQQMGHAVTCCYSDSARCLSDGSADGSDECAQNGAGWDASALRQQWMPRRTSSLTAPPPGRNDLKPQFFALSEHGGALGEQAGGLRACHGACEMCHLLAHTLRSCHGSAVSVEGGLGSGAGGTPPWHLLSGFWKSGITRATSFCQKRCTFQSAPRAAPRHVEGEKRCGRAGAPRHVEGTTLRRTAQRCGGPHGGGPTRAGAGAPRGGWPCVTCVRLRVEASQLANHLPFGATCGQSGVK
jgi:hypothetical protein